MDQCVVCFNRTELLCQRCRTPYCSRKCQAVDWPVHKTTCIPMPPLVAANKRELQKPQQQLNESVSSVSQRPKYPQRSDSQQKPKQQMNESVSSVSQRLKYPQRNDSQQKPKQQTNESVSSVSQRLEYPQTNDSQQPKQEARPEQEADEPSLRPPKTKLPSQIISPVQTDVPSAVFDNPFIQNSQNIAFNANDIKNKVSYPTVIIPSANETKKTETNSPPSAGVSNPFAPIPSMEIVDEIKETETNVRPNAGVSNPFLSIPATSSVVNETEKAEIIPWGSLQYLSLMDEKKEVVDAEHRPENEGKGKIFTMRDIEIVPLTEAKKIVCLDSSNIAKGYVSACVNDGKAMALIDRLSSKIGECCRQTNACYRPQTDELCLCLFDEDNEWYRAVVLKVIDSETFQINFIDVGNESIAFSKNIRKIPQELLHHCLVNKCYIKGFEDETPDRKLKTIEFFSKNPIFEAAKMQQMKSGVYTIELGC